MSILCWKLGRPILAYNDDTPNLGLKIFIALGYKYEVIKEYFLNTGLNSDFTVDLATGNIETNQLEDINWKVTLVNTGLKTMTGGRIKD